MEFKGTFLLAMREKDPKLFMALRRSGQLNQYVQEKSQEAHAMLRGILAKREKSPHGNPLPADLREAEEVVLAHFLEFPVPEREQNPEPPDDLPTQESQVSTTESNPAH